MTLTSKISKTFEQVTTIHTHEHWSLDVRLDDLEKQFIAAPEIQLLHYVRHRGWGMNSNREPTWHDGPCFIVNRRMEVLYFEPAGSPSYAQPDLKDLINIKASGSLFLKDVLSSQESLTLNVATLALSHFLRDMDQTTLTTHWKFQNRVLTNAQAAFLALLRLSTPNDSTYKNTKRAALYLPQNFDPHWKRYLQNLGFPLYSINQLAHDGQNIEEIQDMFQPIFAEFCNPHAEALLRALQQRVPVIPETLHSAILSENPVSKL